MARHRVLSLPPEGSALVFEALSRPSTEGPMRRNSLAIAVILTVASGCDNVSWGGVDVRLKPPQTKAELAGEAPGRAASLTEEADLLPELPDGPILLAGTRSGSQATLTVVGEIQGDAFGAFTSDEDVPGFRDRFPAELLAPGSEWVLFAQGVRVGRLTATATGLNEDFCVPRPTISGTVELVPNAMSAELLMALPADVASDRTYDPYRVHADDRDQRIASTSLASAAIPRLGAAWPPDGLLSARADIQAFQMVGAPGEAIAATFMYRDQLGMSAPSAGAYSLFLMGRASEGGYEPTYMWYRPVDSEGKGAPRYFDHLDWDGDGNEEVLLDVFGSERRWFAALAQRSGTWVRTSEDSCLRSAAAGG